MLTEQQRRLVEQLHAIQAVKFGEFQLKSGAISPFYIDLRGLVSHPQVLRTVAEHLLALLAPLRFDRVAGIPYAGLPIATAVSLAGNLPMIYARKEAKGYGTRRLVEGAFAPGDVAVLLDDVISDGASKFESAEPLIEAGLVVRDFVVLLDRETGGGDRLREKGFALHAALRITDVLAHLRDAGRLAPALHTRCLEFLAAAR